MKIVIRAGGSGTKLWPLSRQQMPKQFLPLFGKQSLLEAKMIEIRSVVKSWNDIYVSVTEPFVPTVRKLAPRIPKNNIIVEPIGRNTGPAIGLESALIQAATGATDPVIASLTVDDIFTAPGKFRNALRAAELYLHKNPAWVVTVASRIEDADTGLSYISLGKKLGSNRGQIIKYAKNWIEKPEKDHLIRLLKKSNVFAHTGLYIWKASTILSLFEKYQPGIHKKLLQIQSAYGKKSFKAILDKTYKSFPSISIENAITKNENKIAVCAGRYGWSDTGKWYLVKDVMRPGSENISRGNVIVDEVTDSLIFGRPEKITGVVGLSGIIVVDTGDALLVCSKKDSANVSKLIIELKKRKLDKYL